MKKKLISGLLAVVLIAAPILTDTVIAEAAEVNTNQTVQADNAAQQRNNIVNKAVSQIGVREGGNNYTKYGVYTGHPNTVWSGSFVSWCAHYAGIPTTIIPKQYSVSVQKSWFTQRGRWHGRSYRPKKGDIIFLANNTEGIVEAVSGATVRVIQGDLNNQVARKIYAVGNAQISGYAVPAYR